MAQCDIKELGILAHGASGSQLDRLDYNFLRWAIAKEVTSYCHGRREEDRRA